MKKNNAGITGYTRVTKPWFCVPSEWEAST